MLNIYYLPDTYVISVIPHNKPDILFAHSTNEKIKVQGGLVVSSSEVAEL